MPSFKLGSGAGQFELAIDGSASQAGAVVGNWRTTTENKIQVKKDDGTSTVFDVGWKFNADNQLVLPNIVGRAKTVDGAVRPVIEQTFPVSLTPPPSPLCKL